MRVIMWLLLLSALIAIMVFSASAQETMLCNNTDASIGRYMLLGTC